MTKMPLMVSLLIPIPERDELLVFGTSVLNGNYSDVYLSQCVDASTLISEANRFRLPFSFMLQAPN